MFLVLRISKNWHFLTPLPPTSADVIYEWYLFITAQRNTKAILRPLATLECTGDSSEQQVCLSKKEFWVLFCAS